MRYEAMDMHLVNRNAGREAPFCGADASGNERIGLEYYLEQRRDGFGVGNVCQECKALAVTLAGEIIEGVAHDLEAEGRTDMAEDYRQLAKTLARETGQNAPGG